MMKLLALFLLLVLNGCASIPLSSAIELSEYDSNILGALGAADIQVQVQVPLGFEINPTATVLTLALSGESDSFSGKFELEVLSSAEGEIPGSFFSDPIKTRSYRLAMTDDAIRSFSEVQAEFHTQSISAVNYSVEWKFSNIPNGAESVRIWVDLTLEKDQEPIRLFNGVELTFNSSRS